MRWLVLYIFLMFSLLSEAQIYDLATYLKVNQIEQSNESLLENLSRVDSFLREDKKDLEWYFHRAWAYRSLDSMKQAIEHFELIQRDSSYRINALWGLTDCYLHTGDKYIAMEHLDMIIDFDPYNIEALVRRSDIKWEIEDIEGALSDWKTIIWKTKVGNQSIQVYQRLSDYYYEKGNNKKALEFLNQAVENNPEDSLIYEIRALYFLREGEFDKALEDVNKSIEYGGINFGIKGKANFEIENFFEAIQDCNKWIEQDSLSVEAYLYRGRSKHALEDYRGAILDFNKGLRIHPQKAVLYIHRGHSKLLLGREEEACFDYSKSGELGYEPAYKVIQRECR